MASGTGVRDFTDYANQPWPGKTLPLAFNNVENAGDGFPGVQWAMRTWTKDYLHSGGMETGLFMEGNDITDVANIYIAGNAEIYGDISGDLDNISGFDIISADTGLFSKLEGFSDIEMLDSLDFKDIYHIKGADEITGINALITNAKITNATQNIAFGGSYTLTALASGDANGEPIRYNEYIAHQNNVSNPHTVGLSQAFTQDKTIYEANSIANALKIGTSADHWCMFADGNQPYMYMNDADTDFELGVIGYDGSTIRPLWKLYSMSVYTNDGGILTYSHVDDLQLLRDVKKWDVKQKVVNEKFPHFKQDVFDMNTLPWIKAHPDIDAIDTNDNKRYMSSSNQKIGYLLSTMQKILERQDGIMIENELLKKRILELENN